MKAGYLLTTAAALGFAMSGGAAHATLTYTIWNGDMPTEHSAQPPVPTSSPFATFTDPGNPINFVNNGPDTIDGSDNLFSEFFTAPVLAECDAANSACGGTIMSTVEFLPRRHLYVHEDYRDLNLASAGDVPLSLSSMMTAARSTLMAPSPAVTPPRRVKTPKAASIPLSAGLSPTHNVLYRGRWGTVSSGGEHPERSGARARLHGAPRHSFARSRHRPSVQAVLNRRPACQGGATGRRPFGCPRASAIALPSAHGIGKLGVFGWRHNQDKRGHDFRSGSISPSRSGWVIWRL